MFTKFISDIPLFALFNIQIKPDTIPSFIFHKVELEEFEGLLLYLKNNNYRTLSIGEYYEYIKGNRSDNGKKVILTFDDGLFNNWSIVYPLLKKYDMKAVFYVNPGRIENVSGYRYSLEDVWNKKISLAELQNNGCKHSFISWEEARKMESSGLVSIESHTWQHKICFVSDKIIDFQHPDKDGRPKYPWLFSAIDAAQTDCIWGAPVYPFKPRMVALKYFDDKALRRTCINFVKESGGVEFFKDKNWRSKLNKVVKDYRMHNHLNVHFETEIEQELSIRDSLISAKKKIEQELDKTCLHFAFPWSAGGVLSSLWLKELGFKTVFRFMNSWNMPHTGCDPFMLSRIEGYWITSLPGKTRFSLWRKIWNRVRIREWQKSYT